MFCGKCGKKIEDGAAVCKWCGAAVETGTQPETDMHSGTQPKPGNDSIPAGRASYIPSTELGISVCLLGAAVYWSGMFNELAACLLAGYILLKEKDAWLRIAAVKSVIIIIGFAILNGGISVIQNTLSGFDNFLSLVGTYPIGYTGLHQLCTFLGNLSNVAQSVLLLIGGFQAVKYKNFGLGKIDAIIAKNLKK